LLRRSRRPLSTAIRPSRSSGRIFRPRVVRSHAPTVPQCALAFARLFEQAGAPEGVYTHLFCTVEQVGALIDDFRVRGVTLIWYAGAW
jgi:hypothetical protein